MGASVLKKIFSFLRGKKEKTKRIYSVTDYDVIESIWTTQNATEELLNHLKLCYQSPLLYKHMPYRCWLILISCLVETGQEEYARKVLKKYISNHGFKDIHRFFIVAKFANQEGFSSPLIEKSVYVWDYLSDPARKIEFQNFILDKTVAVVGNSGCELGKGKGFEIDKNDIVIRCSNYPKDKKYVVDYGEKTSIWLRNSCSTIVHKEDISSYDFVIWKDDFSHFMVKMNHLDVMYDYIKEYKNKLHIIDYSYFKSLREEYGIVTPSSGCILIWYLYKLAGSTNSIRPYGFSFINKDYKDTKHYYDNLCKISTDHGIKQEIDFLSRLFNLD